MNNRARRGRPARTLKQLLPYPYNLDFSDVLRGLNRRTPFGRRRLANDPVTAAYLAAAFRLIQRYLGPGADRAADHPGDPGPVSRPMWNFLSQRAVASRSITTRPRSTVWAESRRYGNAGGINLTSSLTCSGSACGRRTTPARIRTR